MNDSAWLVRGTRALAPTLTASAAVRSDGQGKRIVSPFQRMETLTVVLQALRQERGREREGEKKKKSSQKASRLPTDNAN